MLDLRLFPIFFCLATCRPPKPAKCIDGPLEDKCENGGSCLKYIVKNKYYDQGGIIREWQRVFTYCKCPKQYAGRTCLERNTCYYDRPCAAGHFKECTHVGPNEFICDCRIKWTGKRCESPRELKEQISLERNKERNPCRSNPCGPATGTGGPHKRGTCRVAHDELGRYSGYVCKCNEKFTGVHCETHRDCRHDGDTCRHNGTCTKAIKRSRFFYCVCSELYTGFRCETPVPSIKDSLHIEKKPPGKRRRLETDPCRSNPCRKGGTCVEYSKGSFEDENQPVESIYRCECPDDITDDCQLPTPQDVANFEHLLQTCLVRGDLNNIPGFPELFGFQDLPDAFITRSSTRQSRSTKIRNPCQNDGICDVRHNQDNICHCPVGVTGRYCSRVEGLTLNVSLEFTHTFSDNLLHSSTSEYKALSRNIRLWVSMTCSDYMRNVCNLLNVKFTPGSIKAHFLVSFDHTCNSQHLKSIANLFSLALKQNTASFPNNSVNIAKSSITVSSINQLLNNIKSKDRILRVVMAVSVFCIIACIISIVFMRKSYRIKKYRANVPNRYFR